jgi:DNA polymerase-3 subunit gamma/tau
MSQFVVSARKYRPTSFDEVVGQDHIARTLKNALQTGHLAHAFLFTGPRGVGKTTCARILAKIINCEQPINKVEACNQCSSCKAFNDNASFNILELDAASNNSVENIRTLTEQVRFQPQHGKYKVFIIDEVHMLSTAAFNAFLKTLEEPPSYAIFILATTEKHKIIPTILSRCQIFDFRRIQIADAVVQLEKICVSEGIQAEKEALHTIASKADGAMRDALTIFDKIASSTGNVITYKDVVANLNLLDVEFYFTITDAMLREDVAEVFLTLDKIVRQGFDADHFVVGLADHFRDLLIARMPATTQILEVSTEMKNRYIRQAELTSSSFLLSGVQILNQCDIDLVRAKNKRLQVELALAKVTFLSRKVETNLFTGDSSEEKKNPERTQTQRIEVKKTPIESPVEQPLQGERVNESASSVTEKEVPQRPADGGKNLFTDLQAIRDSIRQAEVSKQAARNEVNVELVRQIWDEYAEFTPSKSVQTALKLAIIEYEGRVVHCKVPTQVSKDMILQESPLLDRLRNETGQDALVFQIEVDKSLFPEFEEAKPVVAMTQKERYLYMVEQRPELAQLVQKLGLKLDKEI